MESVHGVDVSWLHQPNRGAATQDHHHAHRAPGIAGDAQPPTSHAAHASPRPAQAEEPAHAPSPPPTASKPIPAPQNATPVPAPAPAPTPAPDSSSAAPRPPSRRPSILGRSPSDRQGSDSVKASRRNSWMTSISSKFSSQPSSGPTAPQTSKPQVNGINAGPSSQSAKDNLASSPPRASAQREVEELQPYVPQKPKESNSSFFSNLTRRLSAGAQTAGSAKTNENGGVCPRTVLNRDPTRERCLIPELDSSKLRRVAFSVDVEIASAPRYKDYKDDEGDASKQKKVKDKKVKERAEGEALRHPQAVAERKDQSDAAATPADDDDAVAGSPVKSPDASPDRAGDNAATTEDPTKKARTEEERRERKERKRRRAEESGSVPMELSGDKASGSLPSQKASPTASGATTPKAQPTTDPVRIYRRCCQLRESPILKRITEQLMAPDCCTPDDPGVVTQLNLTGSRLQLADVVTLGDWLAIVPVKRLLLEDADLIDEGLRVILAGLLASKKPEPSRRRNGVRQPPSKPTGGIVEKITLKNNPRVTKVGWKYIAVFLHMCRSIKALDVSMLKFPVELPPSAADPALKAPSRMPKTTGQAADAAETLCRALTGRLGGPRLEELTMNECGLAAHQIRKVVDGATVCGIARLGFAGNGLDDEGFEHVLHYVRSGVCHALDLGSNNLHGRLGLLAEALTHNAGCPTWGLSLAGCGLDMDSLKKFLPALTTLPNFRFIDLSHNRRLFSGDVSALHLLRRYLPKLKTLKRLHLVDVNLSVKQAISLAEVVPEAPSLAHLTILENPQLSKLAQASDEDSKEEACALYASLCAAARVSKSIMCIDVDVPCPEQSEVVRALAKQVVAYCLRNMDRTMAQTTLLPVAATLSTPHGLKDARRGAFPEVLVHLVGDLDNDDVSSDGGDDEPAPDDDYIVGGNGIVKALEYFLGEDAFDLRRSSITASGTTTPVELSTEDSSDVKRRGKAKAVSKNLLDSARKLRCRLKPALSKELAAGDEIHYRRLLFLDETLHGMILRFENEFPETRIHHGVPEPEGAPLTSSSLESTESGPLSLSSEALANSDATFGTESSVLDSEVDEDSSLSTGMSRKNSDVSLASRALSLEEGRIHRMGHRVRQDILNVPGTAAATPDSNQHAEWAPGSHMADLATKLADMSGPELRTIVDSGGWDGVMEKLGANLEELRQLQMKDPIGWQQFKESQLMARANR